MWQRIITQCQLFLLALSFFSRIPVLSWTIYSEERMNHAGRYFGLVGVVLGLICACLCLVLTEILPTTVAIILTMIASLMLTGAFHEDGLADMADGIGGGMDIESRLRIMKDSRIGTYGTAALVVILLSKWTLLTQLSMLMDLFPVWLLGYSLSRSFAASLIYDMNYVTDVSRSKSKPLAKEQTQSELFILFSTGASPLILFPMLQSLAIVITLACTRLLIKKWLKHRIGGFTGDCLGGTQQIMENLIYIVILAFAFHKSVIG